MKKKKIPLYPEHPSCGVLDDSMHLSIPIPKKGMELDLESFQRLQQNGWLFADIVVAHTR